MLDIVGKKNIYFIISILILLPGIIALFLTGLNLSIDFTGGSRMEFEIQKEGDVSQALREVIVQQDVEVNSVQRALDDNIYIVRTKPLEEEKHQQIKEAVTEQFPDAEELVYETVGPTMGREITMNAFQAIAIASILIVLYIAWSFRKVPKPASSIRFGLTAIIALLHDVLAVVGAFAIFGHFFGVEVDSLFVTALLTTIGFSVHDTIVVFDRIRENLRRLPGVAFAEVTNASILQTMQRSLNTSVTTLLVLFTLLLFGGESIRWFVVALIIGIISGTYSSIFTAAPFLVVWHNWSERRKKTKK